jgi:hypothetical protein
MAMKTLSNDDTSLTSAAKKKPYEKPGFRYEQVFVTTALSCGKIDPFSLNCASSKSS